MTTEETPSEDEVPRRRSIRSGATALIASIILILWIVLTLWMVPLSAGNAAAGVILGILGFASIIVIPGLIIVILVLAIIALLFNPVPGKIMAAVAVVLPVIVAAVTWGQIGGFSESFYFNVN
jgi:hypothetical protein